METTAISKERTNSTKVNKNFGINQIDVTSINIKTLIEKETGLNFKRYTLEKCPFCGSGTGQKGTSAFSIKIDKNIFSCFACDKTGNPIQFITNYKNLQNKEAINYLLQNYSNMPVSKVEPVKKNADGFSKIVYAIKQNDISKATDYLKGRGIDTEKLKGFYFYDSIEKAVCFFDSEEKLINKRIVKPAKNETSHKNATGSIIKNAVYDKTFIADQDTIIISEKPIDALTLFNFEYSVISVFSAVSRIDNKEKLSKYITAKNVILSFDNDEAGNKAILYYKDYILNNFQVTSLKKILYQSGIDANELQQQGKLKDFLNDTANFETLKQDYLKEPIPNIEKTSDSIYYSIKNKFYKDVTIKGKEYPTVISNFNMQILYHLKDGTEDSRRLIKVQRHTSEIELFEISNSKLTGENFKTILRSRGDRGFSFTGQTADLESILAYLYDYENTAIPLYDAGYYPEHEIFSFSNAIVNQDNEIIRPNEIGILTDSKKCFYLSKASQAINQKLDTDFTYKEGTILFEQYSDLIYKSYGVDGIIGLCFFINSLFRDFVFSVTGCFPFLYLYGEPGTGKTSFIDIMRSPYNKNDLGHALNTSTYKALGRAVSQHENYIVYFKEYSQNINPEILELLKTSYDGSSYSRAKKSNDNSIIDGKCKSAVILDGNSLPTYEAAIYDRIILLDFDSAKFTEQQKKAHTQLKQEIEKGTSQIIKEIIKHRKTFASKFKNTYNDIFETIKQSDKEHNGAKIKEIRNRTIEHTAFLLATYKIFSAIFKFPADYKEISTKIIDYAIEKEQTLNIIKPISVFWSSIEYNLNSNQYNQNITDKNLRIDENYIYIKIDNLYPFYIKYCKDNNKKYEDMTGLKRLLSSKNNLAFVPGNRGDDNNKKLSHNLYGFGGCYRFTYEKIEEQIFVNNIELNIDFKKYSGKVW